MDGLMARKPKAPGATPLLPRHVRHALDYMRANLGEKVTQARCYGAGDEEMAPSSR
jgi:hypothetical protein